MIPVHPSPAPSVPLNINTPAAPISPIHFNTPVAFAPPHAPFQLSPISSELSPLYFSTTPLYSTRDRVPSSPAIVTPNTSSLHCGDKPLSDLFKEWTTKTFFYY